MTKDKYIDDLREIREMMNRSSRFISLSGLSGVFAGVFALIGAYLAYDTIYSGQDYLGHRIALITLDRMLHLLLIGAGVMICSIITGIYFTTKKAKQKNQKIFNQRICQSNSSANLDILWLSSSQWQSLYIERNQRAWYLSNPAWYPRYLFYRLWISILGFGFWCVAHHLWHERSIKQIK